MSSLGARVNKGGMRNLAFVALLWLGVLPAAPSVAQSTNAPAAKQVLFVCTGNYYRSRFAESLFNSKVRDSRLGWKAISRGLRTQPDRKGISPLARQELRKRGVPEELGEGDAQPLTAERSEEPSCRERM